MRSYHHTCAGCDSSNLRNTFLRIIFSRKLKLAIFPKMCAGLQQFSSSVYKVMLKQNKKEKNKDKEARPPLIYPLAFLNVKRIGFFDA